MPFKDPEKQKAAQREHLRRKSRANPQWLRALKRQLKQNRTAKRQFIDMIKAELGCLLCNESNPANLAFHHVDPKLKRMTIADHLSRRSKLIHILHEIDRCVCVCSSCHRFLHGHIEILLANIRGKPWFRDWTVAEGLEWLKRHPQSNKGKSAPETLCAVLIRCQYQDIGAFLLAMRGRHT